MRKFNLKYRYWLAMTFTLSAMNVLAIEPSSLRVEMQSTQINLGNDCRVGVTLPTSMKRNEQGSLVWYPMPSWWKSKNSDYFQLNIQCISSSSGDLPSTLASFDVTKNLWTKDKSYFKKSILEVLHDPRNTSAAYQPKNENEYIDKVYKATDIFDLKTSNAHGWAEVAWVVPSGDLNDNRSLSFCLFHVSKAVCGTANVAKRSDSPNNDLTKYVLEILRSIEFLEDAPVIAPMPTK